MRPIVLATCLISAAPAVAQYPPLTPDQTINNQQAVITRQNACIDAYRDRDTLFVQVQQKDAEIDRLRRELDAAKKSAAELSKK